MRRRGLWWTPVLMGPIRPMSPMEPITTPPPKMKPAPPAANPASPSPAAARTRTALDAEQALRAARRIGFPVLVRPSYVLGGRAMQIVYDEAELARYMERAVDISPGKPILIDQFLESVVEVDVDCLADGERVVIG